MWHSQCSADVYKTLLLNRGQTVRVYFGPELSQVIESCYIFIRKTYFYSKGSECASPIHWRRAAKETKWPLLTALFSSFFFLWPKTHFKNTLLLHMLPMMRCEEVKTNKNSKIKVYKWNIIVKCPDIKGVQEIMHTSKIW
jgi:hypothetical protein